MSAALARRERRWIAVLLALAGTLLVATMVSERCREDTFPHLLERARTAPTHGERCRALNQLAARGYWDERPTEALVEFLAGAPPGLDAFIREAYGYLLGQRTGDGSRGGC